MTTMQVYERARAILESLNSLAYDSWQALKREDKTRVFVNSETNEGFVFRDMPGAERTLGEAQDLLDLLQHGPQATESELASAFMQVALSPETATSVLVAVDVYIVGPGAAHNFHEKAAAEQAAAVRAVEEKAAAERGY